jgi:hypothetical protein
MEADGNHNYYTWHQLETFDDENDKFNSGFGQNKNHPRIYSSKFHHSMHPDGCHQDKNNCIAFPNDEFRWNDWYMFSLANGNLHSINEINPNWNFGDATNPHATANNICDSALNNPLTLGWCNSKSRPTSSGIDDHIPVDQKVLAFEELELR